jgi:hypothetical protein
VAAREALIDDDGAGPTAFLRQARDVGTARRSASILEIGRFSRPPRVEDLAGLTLDEGDFDAARECKPGDCGIKLARSAMERIRRETKDKFAPKPTISVYHVTIWSDPENAGVAVIASKQIYDSHYFQAGLDLLAVVSAPGGGFYLMDLYRARIDPPTGMLSGVILGKIRGGIEQGVGEGLRAARAREAK